VNAPSPPQNLLSFSSRLKGFHGSYIKQTMSVAYLRDQKAPDVQLASIMRLVELGSLTDEQAKTVSASMPIPSDVMGDAVRVCAAFEFEEADPPPTRMPRRASLELHSDSGAIMTCTADGEAWQWAFPRTRCEPDDEHSQRTLKLCGTCTTEKALGMPGAFDATFELTMEDGGCWCGMVGGPDGQRWEAHFKPSVFCSAPEIPFMAKEAADNNAIEPSGGVVS